MYIKVKEATDKPIGYIEELKNTLIFYTKDKDPAIYLTIRNFLLKYLVDNKKFSFVILTNSFCYYKFVSEFTKLKLTFGISKEEEKNEAP